MKTNSVKKQWHLRVFLQLACLAMLLTSCYPGGAEYVEDYDAVYTNYSSDFNFNTTYSYSLPDRVIKVGNNNDDDDTEYINEAYSDAILSNLRSNLNALGWTEVSVDANPEVVVLASGFDQSFYYYYNPWYWDWYYPWYGPNWGWYYPFTPGYVSGYKTGSVLVQMTVPDDAEDNKIPVVWMAALNGLLQGGQANIVNRIDTNLDQAFSQSPFNN
ncbi:DUF4136 domain-containing protein [Formosa haliotis]|uniref:DUF4136 domain-containing protein n=1 Tax=Formosa haliotis TaxID=1555194 RepID=UPI0008246E55|nr:DUF4136 domain-containing protein [Formosa haliotis]